MKTCIPKPDQFKLGDLPDMLERGEIVVPQFQRKFVWSIKQSAKLLDSIFKGYPIGTITLWFTRERMRQVKRIAGNNFPPAKKGYPVYYVLDGQQRLTSMYACLRGADLSTENIKDPEDYNKVFLRLDGVDGDDDDLVVTDVSGLPEDSYISIKDLFDSDYDEWKEKYGKRFKKVYDYFDKLKSYPIPMIKIPEIDLVRATSIFTRINTSGQKLTAFEVVAAKVYREAPYFDLIEKRDEQKERWARVGYDSINEYVSLQAMALCLKGKCTKQDVLSLTSDEVADNWTQMDKAFAAAIDYLRKSFHIPSSDLLPYDVLLIPFVYFMYRSKGEKPNAEQVMWLKDYFWRTALSHRFSDAVVSKLGQDVKFFDAIVDGKRPNDSHLPSLTISPKIIASKGTFKMGSAFVKAILCLFAGHKPLSLSDGERVITDKAWLSKKNARNFHHFFPKAYMEKEGWSDSTRPVNNVANIIIIASDENQDIKKTAPSKYISKFRKKNPRLNDALKSHLIGDVDKFGVTTDDYKKFFDQRVGMICRELKKCIVPREMDDIQVK